MAVLLTLAATLQTGLLLSGLYSLAVDESARALLAHKLTLANAFEPFVWPPLGSILNRLALALHDDLFLTPRLLVSATGLVAILGIAFVTHALFASRLMAVVAAALSIIVPHRLLLAVAPLSDIFGTTLLLFAAGFLILWLRDGRPRDLTAASALLFFASMARYELWLFNAVLGLYMAYRTLIRRDLGFGQLVLNGALVSAFPIFWLLYTYIENGNLDLFTLTSRQFIDKNGRDLLLALKGNVAVALTKDFLVTPTLILGAGVLALLSFRQKPVRDWTILILAPLVILAVQMAVSFGVPMAAPFRIDAAWVLLLLPFAAFGLVLTAERLMAKRSLQFAVLALAVYIAAAPFALRTNALAKGHQTADVMSKDDLQLGRYLRSLAARDGRNFLLDATSSLGFLNVPVAANLPDRFALDVDEDPLLVALYVDAIKGYKEHGNRAIVDRYLTDKFGLADGLDHEKLRARKIGYLVIENPGLITALDHNPEVRRLASYGHWVVYGLDD